MAQSLEGPFLEQPIIYTESTTPVSLQLVPVRTVDLSTDCTVYRKDIAVLNAQFYVSAC